MSKYYLGYKVGNKYEKVDLSKLKDIEFNKLKRIELLMGKDYKRIQEIRERYINSIINVLMVKDGSLYEKFNNKSYSLVDKLFSELSVDFKKIKLKHNYNFDSVMSINYFTTTFDNSTEMLAFLKSVGLLNKDIDKLYLCKNSKGELQKEDKALFFSKDRNKLNIDYVRNVLENANYDTLNYIFTVYERKCKNKYPAMSGKCNTLKNIIFEKKSSSFVERESLEIYDVFLKDFIDYMFYGTTDGKTDYKKVSYSRINEFVGILNYKNKLSKDKVIDEKYVDEEMMSFIENEVSDLPDFEPYIDGNDYIAPLDSEELKSDLLEKYGRKR